MFNWCFDCNFHATVMKTISPIASFNRSFIFIRLKKNTLIVVPVFAWNMADNFDLDFTAQSFLVRQSDSYKNVITQIYIRGRWSFLDNNGTVFPVSEVLFPNSIRMQTTVTGFDKQN